MRLDRVLVSACEGISRSIIHRWITDGNISVNGSSCKPSYRVQGDEQVVIEATMPQSMDWTSESDIEFQIIYSDEDIIVVDKPPGLVVHPGAGNPNRTLVNGLLFRFPNIEDLPRCGIVHRLDKNTTGVMVVAHSRTGLEILSKEISEKVIKREYEAVAEGVVERSYYVDEPIGRHPIDRTKQCVSESGRAAQTEFVPLELFRRHTLLKAILGTGRTHQIRVHANHIGHPILGDKKYGAKGILPKLPSAQTAEQIQSFDRQALHAYKLELNHPRTGEKMVFKSELPRDIDSLIQTLRDDADR